MEIAHWPILPSRMGVSAYAAGDAGGGAAAIAKRTSEVLFLLAREGGNRPS
ncbi:hypothetical protein C4K28_3632 [Pseudomonas chlororaphis subsp. piscium]|nr:hypothetical protein C4K28_3632 [Pseudomonas chlororaphis subsp. piscium]